MIIRPYIPADLLSVESLVADMLAESPKLKDIKLRPGLIEKIEMGVRFRPSDYCCFVAENNNELVGLYVGYISSDFLTGIREAYDIIAYVTPEWRSHGTGRDLLNHFLLWAEDNGARKAWGGVSSLTNPHVSSALYQGAGYEDATIPRFVKELNNVRIKSEETTTASTAAAAS